MSDKNRLVNPRHRDNLVAVGFVFLCLIFIWRVVSTGVAAYFAAAPRGDVDSAQTATVWSPDRSDALITQGDAARGVPEAAAESYRAAVRANPAAALALAKLALAWQSSSVSPVSAEQAAQLAVALAPSDPTVHWLTAQFWLNADRWAEASVDLSVALAADPRFESRLFPFFLALSENPKTGGIVANLARQPPLWWARFLAYAATNAVRLETVRSLFALTRDLGIVPGERERRALIERLQEEQRWTEAYLEWLDSLSPEPRAHIGLLYNGSFDFPIANTGFDWRRLVSAPVRIEQAPSPGLDGPYGLRVTFDGVDLRGRIVEQFLLLTPGRYRLEGNARVGRSQGALDMAWELLCVNDTLALARSESFSKVEQWHGFKMEFEVAESCSAQRLQLVVRPERSAPREKLTAEVWFDALRVIHVAVASGGKS